MQSKKDWDSIEFSIDNGNEFELVFRKEREDGMTHLYQVIDDSEHYRFTFNDEKLADFIYELKTLLLEE